ncbi:MAG: (2Fe-2S)-binding protein [Acidobacteria bacterium]|nr:(2Fe-2S)-binding protein [Acidobacteriota bacterium]
MKPKENALSEKDSKEEIANRKLQIANRKSPPSRPSASLGERGESGTGREESLRFGRRTFVKGVAASAVLTQAPISWAEAEVVSGKASGNIQSVISLKVNGVEHRLVVDNRRTLASVLRNDLDLTGTKIGCDRGQCGACTVLMDGKPVYACSNLAIWADGLDVETIEGLSQGPRLHPLQQAFIEEDALQCGFCTPGQIMAAKALLDSNPNPADQEIRHACSGNLCRCGTYMNIFKAVARAAELKRRG